MKDVDKCFRSLYMNKYVLSISGDKNQAYNNDFVFIFLKRTNHIKF